MSTIMLTDLKTDATFHSEDFNVADKYSWTLTDPRYRAKNGVPYIELVEYEQDLSTLYAQLYYWYGQVKDFSQLTNSVNPYADLYHALPTGVTFRLPYFDDYDHMISQTWEKTKGLMNNPIASKTLNLASNAAKLFKLAPGTSVNQPQVWSGAGNADYSIDFMLFNTLSPDDIKRNLIFKRRIQMSTLHDQRTALLASPPAIFTVKIPGVRYSPAAVIAQLSVTNVGQINMIPVNGVTMAIPDAWAFNIRITELIPESRQLMKDATELVPKITAITEEAPPDIPAATAGEGDAFVGPPRPLTGPPVPSRLGT